MNATAIAALDAVEIKRTIRPDQELLAERVMHIGERGADGSSHYG